MKCLEEGTKHDQGKPDYTLISKELMDALAEVRAFGAKKYSKNNWKKGFPYTKSIAAALRHVYAFLSGQDLDFYPDSCDGCLKVKLGKEEYCKDKKGILNHSGCSHLICAIASLEHVLYSYIHQKHLDDRYSIVHTDIREHSRSHDEVNKGDK